MLIAGKELDSSPDVRREFGAVFHESFLYDSLTAAENLEFYGRMYQVGRLASRTSELLEQVGLSLYSREPVRTFSRGMKQRLAIARALLHDPAVLFLDEPYTGLDQEATNALSALLAAMKSSGRTVMMISHSFEQGLLACDRAMVISRGEIKLSADSGGLAPEVFKERYLKVVEERPRKPGLGW